MGLQQNLQEITQTKLNEPTLKKALLRELFSAASILRWNDQASPIKFWELDKQAHKIVIAYVVAKSYEQKGEIIDWEKLIQYFLFELFSRIVLTDIKPPVFYELEKQAKHELYEFVYKQSKDYLLGYEFFKNMKSYLLNEKILRQNLESKILGFAHMYASKCEFDIIYNFNPRMYGVEKLKKDMDHDLEKYYQDHGMKEIISLTQESELISIFGQLKFQKRWSQTPRIPQTSVLGHTLIVAITGYLLSFDFKACKKMRINHFLCGLFHDLPEALTRDIISPVKKGIKGLDIQLKNVEKQFMKKALSKIPDNIRQDIEYFTENEFKNRWKEKGKIMQSEALEKNKSSSFLEEHNKDEDDPIYGEFLKVCDLLGAFLEANSSIMHGIKSKELMEGEEKIFNQCKDVKIGEVDIGAIFRDLRL